MSLNIWQRVSPKVPILEYVVFFLYREVPPLKSSTKFLRPRSIQVLKSTFISKHTLRGHCFRQCIIFIRQTNMTQSQTWNQVYTLSLFHLPQVDVEFDLKYIDCHETHIWDVCIDIQPADPSRCLWAQLPTAINTICTPIYCVRKCFFDTFFYIFFIYFLYMFFFTENKQKQQLQKHKTVITWTKDKQN